MLLLLLVLVVVAQWWWLSGGGGGGLESFMCLLLYGYQKPPNRKSKFGNSYVFASATSTTLSNFAMTCSEKISGPMFCIVCGLWPLSLVAAAFGSLPCRWPGGRSWRSGGLVPTVQPAGPCLPGMWKWRSESPAVRAGKMCIPSRAVGPDPIPYSPPPSTSTES